MKTTKTTSLITQAGREELKAKIEGWSDANPYKAILTKRLTAMGGPHKPSTVEDDQHGCPF